MQKLKELFAKLKAKVVAFLNSLLGEEKPRELSNKTYEYKIEAIYEGDHQHIVEDAHNCPDCKSEQTVDSPVTPLYGSPMPGLRDDGNEVPTNVGSGGGGSWGGLKGEPTVLLWTFESDKKKPKKSSKPKKKPKKKKTSKKSKSKKK